MTCTHVHAHITHAHPPTNNSHGYKPPRAHVRTHRHPHVLRHTNTRTHICIKYMHINTYIPTHTHRCQSWPRVRYILTHQILRYSEGFAQLTGWRAPPYTPKTIAHLFLPSPGSASVTTPTAMLLACCHRSVHSGPDSTATEADAHETPASRGFGRGCQLHVGWEPALCWKLQDHVAPAGSESWSRGTKSSTPGFCR